MNGTTNKVARKFSFKPSRAFTVGLVIGILLGMYGYELSSRDYQNWQDDLHSIEMYKTSTATFEAWENIPKGSVVTTRSMDQRDHLKNEVPADAIKTKWVASGRRAPRALKRYRILTLDDFGLKDLK